MVTTYVPSATLSPLQHFLMNVKISYLKRTRVRDSVARFLIPFWKKNVDPLKNRWKKVKIFAENVRLNKRLRKYDNKLGRLLTDFKEIVRRKKYSCWVFLIAITFENGGFNQAKIPCPCCSWLTDTQKLSCIIEYLCEIKTIRESV